ncbi:MAG: hypothetical protein KUG77_12930 [Nannocystaceae bacterium]|nr:hypothetical protein [Nannocystaceae bacterium]
MLVLLLLPLACEAASPDTEAVGLNDPAVSLAAARTTAGSQVLILQAGRASRAGTVRPLQVRARFALSQRWSSWRTVASLERGAQAAIELDRGAFGLIDLVEVTGDDADPAQLSVEVFDGLNFTVLTPRLEWVNDIPSDFASPDAEGGECCVQEGSDIWCGVHGAEDDPPTCPSGYILVNCPEGADICDCAGAINLPGCANP